MQYLRVNNWETFQHYKDRNPPWIKLHRDLLRDYEFICLQDASKMQLMLIWLLASQMDNKIPADPLFIQSQLGLKEAINLKELIDKGFLVDDSGVLAGCKQVAIVETETEAETYREETEKELSVKKPKKSPMDLYIEISNFDNFWDAYGKIGNKQQAIKSYNKSIKEGASHEEILGGLTNYQSQCQANNTEQRFIKHASTWLNNRGWEDDYTIHEPAANSGISAARAKMLNELGLG